MSVAINEARDDTARRVGQVEQNLTLRVQLGNAVVVTEVDYESSGPAIDLKKPVINVTNIWTAILCQG